MTVTEQAQRLAANGRTTEAANLLQKAADSGDIDALYTLGHWRLFGVYVARDLKAAHDALDRARASGHIRATGLKAILVGNGTGCRINLDESTRLLRSIQDRDPYAALQLEFEQNMRSAEEVAGLPVELLSEKPLIRAIRGLLLPEECNYLINRAKPALEPSYVIDPESGERIPHPVRTSSGMSFGPTQEDRIVHLINRRLARVTNTPVGNGEPLHMLHYAPGQEYRPHLDAIPGLDNQRHWTVLVYLNDDYSGGATRFDRLDIEFAGREGDALIFRNIDDRGGPEPLTRHAGLPVTGGVKWLATRWIRNAPYHPWDE